MLVGYIGYSIFVHAFYRDSPTTEETIVVLFASILPDIIDKPLAWEFGIFASGRALAHSIFFGIPLSFIVIYYSWRKGRFRTGLAFTIGYLLHLVADVFPTYLVDGELPIERILWPIYQDGGGYEAGFREEFIDNVREYYIWIYEQLVSGNPDPYLLLVLVIGVFGLLLWIYDGFPVGREVYRTLRHYVKTIVRYMNRG